MDPRRALGDYGERLAARHLVGQGMEVLAQGWRCARGEIDLIALDEGCLVFCEVKTRRSERAGGPLDAVTAAKLARVRHLAAQWLADQQTWYDRVRFDVVAITVPPRGAPRLEHLRGVFQ